MKLDHVPTGDEWAAIPKWDCETVWDEPCDGCGEPVEVCKGSIQVIGAFHSGCFGYPACGCLISHKGECST